MNRKLNNLLSRTAFAVFFITALGTQASAQSRIFLKETTLMHEMRATPSTIPSFPSTALKKHPSSTKPVYYIR